jgi:FlaA1/EpsC-like NDP-sugar epimerase
MGTSKRMAELILQALAKKQKSTRFCMVRFGNVLGSSGSVVPLFRKQIRQGGPVTLTHPDITRYFMTIPEAAQLVIQAGAMGKGGDVFVLDMGESVKIFDLASKIIHLSGLSIKDTHNPNGDIEIKCTGLRPGEKLYEELLIGDNVSGTSHERIMTAQETMLDWETLDSLLTKLDKACHNFDHELIREILLSAPTGFNPTDGICDLVWQQKSKVAPTMADVVKLEVV